MLKLNTSKGCFEDNILKIVAASRVIPILDIIDNFDYRRLVDNYYQYGFRTVEIRICSSHAKELVSYIQKNYPDIYIFAGTCLSVNDIDKARFMPSGGITIEKLPFYINEPNVAACCTSHISPFNLQEINDWQGIQNNIRTASQIINTYLEN